MTDSIKFPSEFPTATIDSADKVIAADVTDSNKSFETTVEAMTKAGMAASDTGDLPEGSNLYFTNARAIAAGQYEVEVKTNDYIVTTDDNRKLFEMDASSTARAVTLPSAATAGEGFEVVIKTDGGNGTTISPAGGDTINDDSSYVLNSDNDAVKVYSDGISNWIATSIFKTNSGDVTGPGVATADGIALFSGTTGKTIKDSGSTLITTSTGAPDSGNVPKLDANGRLDSSFIEDVPVSIASVGRKFTLGQNMSAEDIAYIARDGKAYKYDGPTYDDQTFTGYDNGQYILDVGGGFLINFGYDTTTDDLLCRIGEYDIDGITYGSNQTVSTSITDWSVEKYADGKFAVIGYNSGTGNTDWYTFSYDTGAKTISSLQSGNFGTGIVYPAGDATYMEYIEDNKLFFIYEGKPASQYNVYARVITISTDSMFLNTEITLSSGLGAVVELKPTAVLVDTNTIHAMYFYSSRYNVAKITVSGNTLTKDTGASITNATGAYGFITKLDTNRSIAVYHDGSANTYASVYNDGTLGTEATLSSNNYNLIGVDLVGTGVAMTTHQTGVIAFKNTTGDNLEVLSEITHTAVGTPNVNNKSNSMSFNTNTMIVAVGDTTYYVKDALNYVIGVLQETGVTTESKIVTLNAGESTIHSGLTIGAEYFMDETDGSITTTSSSYPLGMALSTTSILLDKWRN